IWTADDGEGQAPLRWWRGSDGLWTVAYGDEVGTAAIARRDDGTIEVATAEGRWLARPGRRAPEASRAAARADGTIRAPLPGKILRVPAESDAPVAEGEPLVIMSAMKIEVVLRAPAPGRVRSIHCYPDQQVDAGDILVELALDPTD